MPHENDLPKLKVGSAWITRPIRSLLRLTCESDIPILAQSDFRHFQLLAKYRPIVRFYKELSPWDNAVNRARELYTRTIAQVDSSKTIQLIERRNPDAKPFQDSLTVAHKKKSWPDLNTARRALTRRRPNINVLNEEMYASLRKPVVDILGADWKAKHKKSQAAILRRFSSTVKKDNESPLGQPFPRPITPTSTFCTGLQSPNKSSHTVNCVERKDKDLTLNKHLAQNWREKHRIKHEQILSARQNNQLSSPTSLSSKTQSAQNCCQKIVRDVEIDTSTEIHQITEEEETVTYISRATLEAEIGLLKDWFRSQLSRTGSFTDCELKREISKLHEKTLELQRVTQDSQRKLEIKMLGHIDDIAGHIKQELASSSKNFISLRNDVMSEIRNLHKVVQIFKQTVSSCENPNINSKDAFTKRSEIASPTSNKRNSMLDKSDKCRAPSTSTPRKPTVFDLLTKPEQPCSPINRHFWVPDSVKKSATPRSMTGKTEKPKILKVISLENFQKPYDALPKNESRLLTLRKSHPTIRFLDPIQPVQDPTPSLPEAKAMSRAEELKKQIKTQSIGTFQSVQMQNKCVDTYGLVPGKVTAQKMRLRLTDEPSLQTDTTDRFNHFAEHYKKGQKSCLSRKTARYQQMGAGDPAAMQNILSELTLGLKNANKRAAKYRQDCRSLWSLLLHFNERLSLTSSKCRNLNREE